MTAGPTFHGPNPFASEPVVVVTVAAGHLSRCAPSLALQRLQPQFGAWLRDCPSLEPLDVPHGACLLAAHWARGLLNAVRGLIESAGARAAATGAVQVWVGWHDPDLSRAALALALAVVSRVGQPDTPEPGRDLLGRMEILLQACRKRHPDYQARVLMLGARSIGCPVQPAPGVRHWQFGWGCQGRVFFETAPGDESARGQRIAADKLQTHAFLRQLGVPVPEQRAAMTLAEAQARAQELGWPVVVKPSDQGQGKGVSVGVDSAERLAAAFDKAREYSARPVVVERHLAGLDHRLLILHGEFVDALTREPASITGDGRHSVHELVAAFNARRLADPMRARYLRQVAVDEVVQAYLARQGLGPDSVPEAGRHIQLRGNANVSTGGEPVNVRDRVHPQVRAMACAIARALDLRCVGVDYMTVDISRPPAQVGGAVIEVNAVPGLDPHLVVGGFDEPTLGRLVLGPEPGRIPVAVVLAVPAVQQALMAGIDALVGAGGGQLGVIGSGRMRLGSLDLVPLGDTVLQRARQLLAHRSCHAAVLLVDPHEVASLGLPVDRCSLGIGCAAAGSPAAEAARQIARRHADQWLDLGPPADAAVQPAAARLAEWLATTCRIPIAESSDSP